MYVVPLIVCYLSADLHNDISTLHMVDCKFVLLLKLEKDKLTKKDEKKKVAEELNVLFKPVEQKVGKGNEVI